MPLIATIEAQRAAPLSGAVFGTLTAHGAPKRVQMSFLITAVESAGTAAPAPPDAAAGGPVGAFAPVAAIERGMSGVQKTALALVVVSVLLVVLALVLAVTSLRRRIEDDRAPRCRRRHCRDGRVVRPLGGVSHRADPKRRHQHGGT